MPRKKAVLGTMRTQGNSNSTRNVWEERRQFIYDLQSDERCELSYARQVNSSCWWEREDKENWSVRRKWTGAGSPGGACGKESACHCRRHKRCSFDPWVRKIPWRRAWQPTLYSCLENPIDRCAWWTTVHRVAKTWSWLSTAQHIEWEHEPAGHAMEFKLRQKPRMWRGSGCWRRWHCYCQLRILLSFLRTDKLMNPCIHVLIVHCPLFPNPPVISNAPCYLQDKVF